MALDSFWLESGRVDDFEFWTVNIADPTGKAVKNITPYVSEASLSFSYSTHAKVSGSMKVKNKGLINNCYIRIIYKPYIPHKFDSTGKPMSKTVTIATMYAEAGDTHYEDGIYSGTVKLKSVMARYTEDKLVEPFTIKKGANLLKLFKFIMNGGRKGRTMGSGPYVIKNVQNRKNPSNKTISYGSGVDEALAEVVNRLKCEAMVSPMGEIVLQTKVAANKKAVSGTLPSENSVMMHGINKSYSGAGKTNRAALKGTYQIKSGKDTKTKYVYSSYAPTGKTWTHDSTGRFITATYEKNWGTLSSAAAAKKKNDKHVKTKIKKTTVTNYEVDSFYMPLNIGQVWNFKYDGISAKVLVNHIDLEFRESLKMKTTLKVVG